MPYSPKGRGHTVLDAIARHEAQSFDDAVQTILPLSKGEKAAAIFVINMLKEGLFFRGFLGRLTMAPRGWDALERLDNGTDYTPERNCNEKTY